MKQVLQNLRNGDLELADIPCPQSKPGHVLIGTAVSLISAGTERMLIEFGRAGFIEKAWRQPDKLRMVWDKIRTDGILATFDSVQAKLDRPVTLGYCNAGVVLGVGAGVTEFAPGDRVVSNGPHAEIVCVPRTLCAHTPRDVSDEAASFTVQGAIALQGVRLAEPTLGETFVVMGLGLIGLLTVQILRANGCRVIAMDFNVERIAMAGRFGAITVDLSAEDAPAAALRLTDGRGVDGVLIAAATASNDPVHHAALCCRRGGRIILVGIAGLHLSRDDFYQKELRFQVSCSYGPGRYDPGYAQRGQDYPFDQVRWTAQRNFEAVLDLMRDGRVRVDDLISHRYGFDDAAAAYELIAGDRPHLGVILSYGPEAFAPGVLRAATVRLPVAVQPRAGGVVVGVIGAGQYAANVLLPALRGRGTHLKTLVSATGVSGFLAGRKFGFELTSADAASVMEDPDIDAVIIATHHETHAHFVCEALRQGKDVFVEKPLALTRHELRDIENSYAESDGALVMAGFNRRFAPHAQKMRELLGSRSEPKCVVITVNAGAIPANHWTQDPDAGGGRIIGEACHFVDLARYLVGAPITSTQAAGVSTPGIPLCDTACITLSFADGSVASIQYLANGNRAFPKERAEVFCAGRVLRLDNFRSLRGWGWPGFRTRRSWRQDKGNQAAVGAFLQAVKTGGPAPIPFEELLEVSRAVIEIAEALRA